VTALPLLTGLPPLLQPGVQVLILGSMPGQASLTQQRYYGHPRNQFWPLMQALFGVDATLPYAARCQALLNAGVALWDVIGQCQRPGSLDSAIVSDSITFNDVAALCRQYPEIRQIWLNGGKAAQSFRQYLRWLAVSDWPGAGMLIRTLPSTSPAHASVSFTDKLALWQITPQQPSTV
jgi:hypoxanthine-DNA glycosylase